MAQRVTTAERKYLTQPEMDRLLEAANRGRHPGRDRLMILMAFRHGLRVSELIALEWSSIDFVRGRIFIARLKAGRHGTHTLSPEELTALEALKKAQQGSRFVFPSNRGTKMLRTNVNRIIREATKTADIPVRVTPHRLRHSCGFQLADRNVEVRRIQQYLGHKSILSTVVYVDLAGRALDGIWD